MMESSLKETVLIQNEGGVNVASRNTLSTLGEKMSAFAARYELSIRMKATSSGICITAYADGSDEPYGGYVGEGASPSEAWDDFLNDFSGFKRASRGMHFA